MKRALIQSLKKWKTSINRKPLIVRGARQTGKSYLINYFGKNEFDHVLHVNFEKEKHFIPCFETVDAKKIIQSVELVSHQTITPGKTLLFLDEIQVCPNAIQSLRYFYEDFPALHVIAAGSLLEFALSSENFSMPVGRVSYLYLYPMSFHEMLIALGFDQLSEYLNHLTIKDHIPEAVHQQLLEYLRLYLTLGGMPEVVNLYVEHQKLLLCRETQTAILQSYRDDFGKYASQVQQRYCERVFGQSFSLIAKHFKYSDIDPDMDYRGLKQAIQLLFHANVLTPVYYSSAQGFPLFATRVEKKYKLLFLDVGLVQAVGRLPPEYLLKDDIIQLNRGALSEQYVGQHLLTLQPSNDRAELFYWQRDVVGSQAEIDFLLTVDDNIVPIEVKSGSIGRLKSLHGFMKLHESRLGVKLSTAPLDTSQAIWTVPLYLVEQLPRLIRQYATHEII